MSATTTWTASNSSSDPTVPASATINSVAGISRVCTGFSATLACSDADQPPTQFKILDQNNKVLWGGVLSAPAGGSDKISITGLEVTADPGLGMTIVFLTGPVVGSVQAVAFCGRDA